MTAHLEKSACVPAEAAGRSHSRAGVGSLSPAVQSVFPQQGRGRRTIILLDHFGVFLMLTACRFSLSLLGISLCNQRNGLVLLDQTAQLPYPHQTKPLGKCFIFQFVSAMFS